MVGWEGGARFLDQSQSVVKQSQCIPGLLSTQLKIALCHDELTLSFCCINLLGLPGVKGEKGDPGPRPAEGVALPAGDPGDPGANGKIGMPGLNGDNGDAGRQGETGAVGPAGEGGMYIYAKKNPKDFCTNEINY